MIVGIIRALVYAFETIVAVACLYNTVADGTEKKIRIVNLLIAGVLITNIIMELMGV